MKILGFVMSEEAKLILLKDKLDLIRKTRRNFIIIAFVIGFSLIIAIDQFILHFNSIITIVLFGVVGFIVSFSIDRHYSKQEQEIICQIQNLTQKGYPS